MTDKLWEVCEEILANADRYDLEHGDGGTVIPGPLMQKLDTTLAATRAALSAPDPRDERIAELELAVDEAHRALREEASKIATLTRERDEARAEIERLNACLINTDQELRAARECSDIMRIRHLNLMSSDGFIPGAVERQRDEARAKITRLQDTLRTVLEQIARGRSVSIGSIDSHYEPQIRREQVEEWFRVLGEK